jgi:hypothetical protein
MVPLRLVAVLWLALLFASPASTQDPCNLVWDGPSAGDDDVAWAYGCEFTKGNKLASSKTQGDACGPACRSTPTCTHFNFKPDKSKIGPTINGTCTLMTAPAGIARRDAANIRQCGTDAEKDAAAVVCGLRAAQWHVDGNTTWAMGCNFTGTSIQPVNRVAGHECGSHCEKQGKCTHFNWYTGDGGLGTCLLLSSEAALGDETTGANPGGVCGLVARPAEPPKGGCDLNCIAAIASVVGTVFAAISIGAGCFTYLKKKRKRQAADVEANKP